MSRFFLPLMSGERKIVLIKYYDLMLFEAYFRPYLSIFDTFNYPTCYFRPLLSIFCFFDDPRAYLRPFLSFKYQFLRLNFQTLLINLRTPCFFGMFINYHSFLIILSQQVIAQEKHFNDGKTSWGWYIGEKIKLKKSYQNPFLSRKAIQNIFLSKL